MKCTLEKFLSTGLWLVLMAPFVLFFFANHACAEFKLTPNLYVAPDVYVSEEYTDNLLLEPKDEEDDFLTTLYPKIGLRYTSKILNLSGHYGHKFTYYKKNPEYDLTSFSESQRSLALATILPNQDFNVALRHSIDRTSFGDRYTFNDENDLVNKTRTTVYSVNPRYRYNKIKTFRATADYTYRVVNYDDRRGSDTKYHGAYLRLEKDLNHKEDGLRGEAHAARVESDQYEDYKRAHLTVGGILHLGAYWFLEGDIGRARIKPRGGSSFDITIGNLFLNYDKGAIHARVGYTVTYPPSYDEGAYKTEMVEAGLVIKKRAILALHARAYKDRSLDNSQEDRTLRTTVKLDVPLSKRVWASLTGDWSVYEFEPENVTDHRYGAGIGVYRNFRWGDAGVQYLYNAQDSDIASREYAFNYVKVFANIPF